MPPGWPATRARILRRDPWCICGAPSAEVHHLWPGIEEDWALRGLCATCHRAITQAQSAAARTGRVRPPAPACPPDGASPVQRGRATARGDTRGLRGAAPGAVGRGGPLAVGGSYSVSVPSRAVPGSAEKLTVEPDRALASLLADARTAQLAALGPDLGAFTAGVKAIAAGVQAWADALSAALAPLGEAMVRALTVPGWHSEPGPRGPLGDPCGDPPRGRVILVAGLEPPSDDYQAPLVDHRPVESVWSAREGPVKAAPYLSVSRPAGFGAAGG